MNICFSLKCIKEKVFHHVNVTSVSGQKNRLADNPLEKRVRVETVSRLIFGGVLYFTMLVGQFERLLQALLSHLRRQNWSVTLCQVLSSGSLFFYDLVLSLSNTAREFICLSLLLMLLLWGMDVLSVPHNRRDWMVRLFVGKVNIGLKIKRVCPISSSNNDYDNDCSRIDLLEKHAAV